MLNKFGQNKIESVTKDELDSPSLVRPQGLEPRTFTFVVCYSIQLSYGRSSDLNSITQIGKDVNNKYAILSIEIPLKKKTN